jgi:dihydrofolate synthase/folylpolyglutamate synthase
MIDLTHYLRYKEIERFLDSLVFSKPTPHFVPSKHEVTQKNPFGLERIRSFLTALEDPHLKNRYMHIAGTSGKTSTTYFLSNIFQTQGYHIGMFTSPHICTFAEYFTVDMNLPPVQEILDLIEHSKPLIDAEYESKGLGMISYSEFLLAMALRYFSGKNVEYVALEAFLGGRYDATNIIEGAEASIITNIGLDHTHILGDTLEEIATDKIGILKAHCPLITAEQRPQILEIFSNETGKFDADLHVLGQNFRVEHIRAEQERTIFDYRSERNTYKDLITSMCGGFQAHNAALAIRALEIVSQKNKTRLAEDALRTGIASTAIPARYEKVHEEPLVILDGAHNADKIACLVSYLKRRFGSNKVIFVCGFTSGKNPEKMLKSLLEVGNIFYLTRVIIGYREDEEPLYLKSVITALNPSVKARITLDPFVALDMAMDEAKTQQKVVCVTGSLYLAAYLRQRWYPEYKALTYA